MEKLLQSDIPTEDNPDSQAQAEVDHQVISKQVEELSGYLGKVEEQIQQLLKEATAPQESALEV